MKLASIESTFLKKDGDLAGIAFGYTDCDQHECGYEGILDAFGVGLDLGLTGADKLRVTSVPASLRVHRQGAKVILSFLPGQNDNEASATAENFFGRSTPTGEGIMVWWDSESFVLMASDRGAEYLDHLHQAFTGRTVSLGLVSGSNHSQQIYPVFVLNQYVAGSWSSRMDKAA